MRESLFISLLRVTVVSHYRRFALGCRLNPACPKVITVLYSASTSKVKMQRTSQVPETSALVGLDGFVANVVFITDRK